MIDLHLLFAFIIAATLLTLTPGIDTAMVLRSVTAHGRHSALSASVGIAVGCLFWGAVVSIGLGAVLRASEVAYTIVKWLGAGYLIWLGYTILTKTHQHITVSDLHVHKESLKETFVRGFLSNLLNPKVGVFYITFLPQFVPANVNVAGYSFFLAAIHVLLTLIWFSILIAASIPLSRLLHQPKVIKTMDKITGGVFIVFGIKLAVFSDR